MHPRTSWLGLSLLAAFAVQAAVVYKWVDADGVVHFSDQPYPGAEKIYTSSSSAATAAGSAPSSAAGSRQAPKGAAASALGFSEFSIASPVNDQTFFGDDVIAVHLNLAPGLKPSQSIAWHLNGKQLEFPPDAMSFPLPHLDRGAYTLAATITDQETSAAQSSNSVTFYVRQPSALAPQHK
jgi:Domain of unknown function (DUF4124)